MNSLFPFEAPAATRFYLGFLIGGWSLHAIFVSYIVAGSGYLAAVALTKGRLAGGRARDEGPIAARLRDWSPFMLGAAIVAGVAPLVLIQVLYQKRFHTANLPLFHRWMVIVPALIVGFYALYLVKSKRIRAWRYAARVAVVLVALGTFLFTAWTWSENHLLSISDADWVEHYSSGGFLRVSSELAPRLILWVSGAFPLMTLLVGWQIWGGQLRRPDEPPLGGKRCSFLARGGLGVALAAAIAYFVTLERPLQDELLGSRGRAYFVIAAIGWCLQFVAWSAQSRSSRFSTKALIVASVGATACLLSAATLREFRRSLSIDFESLFHEHARFAESGGETVFFVFLLVNSALIGACLWIVRRRKIPGASNVSRDEIVESPALPRVGS